MRRFKHAAVMFLLSIFVVGFPSCTTKKEDLSEKSKQEILQTEKEFEAEVKKNGMVAGFTKYAAPDAVLESQDKLVKGKAQIEQHYKNKHVEGNELEWTALYVDAAASGDLGYTYGNYVYRIKDSSGQAFEYKGIFHTVWKKQPDGSWRFVWD